MSKSGEALVVFMGNVNPVSEWKDNWAYVYNTKVAQNGEELIGSQGVGAAGIVHDARSGAVNVAAVGAVLALIQ